MSVCEHWSDFGRAVCESHRKPLVWGERLGFETLMNMLSCHLFDNTLTIHLPTQRDFWSVWNLDTSTLLQVCSVLFPMDLYVLPSKDLKKNIIYSHTPFLLCVIDINLFPRQCTLQITNRLILWSYQTTDCKNLSDLFCLILLSTKDIFTCLSWASVDLSYLTW